VSEFYALERFIYDVSQWDLGSTYLWVIVRFLGGGVAVTLPLLPGEEGEMVITFDGRDIVYDVNELDEVVLSYAMTIHKSQGSEYPAVIIPLMTQHYTMLQKNLVYTAITRGKSFVILVGQKKALAIAVKNNKATKRWSMLESRLSPRTPSLNQID
jgi:ATP-dependent exoDNAse (exonuclease V) alpha subunit